MVPTRDILTSTYRIRVNGGTGTVFCVNKYGRLYFVTAKHMFVDDGFSEQSVVVDELDVINFCNGVKLTLSGFRVYFGFDNADVAVFEVPASDRLTGFDYFRLTSLGLVLGEQVFLIGFPFIVDHGYKTRCSDAVDAFYLPVVKSGIVSTFENRSNTSFLVDAHNNVGFSGGPVVMKSGRDGSFVCGIVTGFKHDKYKGKPDGVLNSGFTTVCPIKRAIDLIDFDFMRKNIIPVSD